MKNVSMLLIVILTVLSCSVKNSLSEKSNNRIEVIKFMYINDYHLAIDEKSFWQNKEEHALLYIPISSVEKSFISDVKNMKSDKQNSFDFLRYAFIVNSGDKKDTLYSDGNLKNWYSIDKSKKQYYYDKEGEIFKVLLLNYPFFNDCW